MIIILSKTRHENKIGKFLDKIGLDHKIYNRFNLPSKFPEYDMGVSYCWSRLVRHPELSMPEKGWINYHLAPLPEYMGGNPYLKGVEDQVTYWATTVHYMDEGYDTGKIINRREIPLHDPPQSVCELGAIAHYFGFIHFKETIKDIYEGKL